MLVSEGDGDAGQEEQRHSATQTLRERSAEGDERGSAARVDRHSALKSIANKCRFTFVRQVITQAEGSRGARLRILTSLMMGRSFSK